MPKAKTARFEVFKDVKDGWRWRLRARNSEIVAQSEGYTRKRDAERAKKDAIRAFNDAAMAEFVATNQG